MEWSGVVQSILTIDSLVTRLNLIWQRTENAAHLLVLKLLQLHHQLHLQHQLLFCTSIFFISTLYHKRLACFDGLQLLMHIHGKRLQSCKRTAQWLPLPLASASALALALDALFANNCKSTRTQRHFWAPSCALSGFPSTRIWPCLHTMQLKQDVN